MGKWLLKIKDTINLKELEKFGFNECFERDYKKDCFKNVGYVLELYDTQVIIKTKDRIIRFSVDDWGLDEENGSVILAKIFDLIQVGLVEKINEE